MGLLDFLGMTELAESVRELTEGIDELKQDILTSVVGPGQDLKTAVQDITDAVVSGKSPTALEETTAPASPEATETLPEAE